MKKAQPYGPLVQLEFDENEARLVQLVMLSAIDHVAKRTRVFQSVLQRLDASLRRFDDVKYRRRKRERPVAITASLRKRKAKTK